MSTRPKLAVILLVVLFTALAAAQLIRPEFANPATDPGRTIEAQMGKTNPLVAIVDRACRDCHSNETRWPSYAKIAPLSWLMAYGVTKGRSVINFSEWAGYQPEVQESLLLASCEDVTKGKMPGGAWIYLHPEARLTPQDIETVCTAARQWRTRP
jgi:heme-binding protein